MITILKDWFNKNLKYFTLFFLLLSIGTGASWIAQQTEKQDEIPYSLWQEIEKDIISDSQYNFQVMRDLFTPAYNDSVTVEHYDYVNGSWVYWVNHSRVLNSYYFENKLSYRVAFPMFGKLYLIE